jgi:Fur family transcriptional regulator, ferric uptake regulator
MTVSSLSPALSVPSFDEACQVLRERGLRLSAARRLVLEALFAADGPVTAEGIAEGLDGRVSRSDLTSVYRNLEAFEKLGLVRHVHLGHGPGRYTLAGGDREYLACEYCARVRAVKGAELDGVRAAIRDAFGFEARFSHFPIVGRCAACLSKRVSAT